MSDVASFHPAGASIFQVIHYGQIVAAGTHIKQIKCKINGRLNGKKTLHLTGRFQKFDFGRRENLKRYGSPKPPEYDLSNVRTIVHLLHGNTDQITRDEVDIYYNCMQSTRNYYVFHSNLLEQDIPVLVKKLKHAKFIDSMIPGFNHFDFAYGRRVAKVQRRILSIENQYNPV